MHSRWGFMLQNKLSDVQDYWNIFLQNSVTTLLLAFMGFWLFMFGKWAPLSDDMLWLKWIKASNRTKCSRTIEFHLEKFPIHSWQLFLHVPPWNVSFSFKGSKFGTVLYCQHWVHQLGFNNWLMILKKDFTFSM